ncbi:MAG: NUDIX hydrolase, partial [Acidobacteria bacterium]|nr:NUDIX hydrolase [Acidobacteriota bacterium]
DHKDAGLWLPTGGHVEPGEDPRATVVRELHEELGMTAAVEDVGPPRMVTVTTTVGRTAGHTDVSLWYVVNGSRNVPPKWNENEFREARWFSFSEAPLLRSDPHLGRFVAKLSATDA